MNIKDNIERRLDKLPVRQYFGGYKSLVAGILILDVAIILIAPLLAEITPLLAVTLSWIWLLLPGLILSFYLAGSVSWWERIPISLVLTVGFATPITILAILLGFQLTSFLLLHTTLLLIAAIILLYYQERIRQNKSDDLSLPSRITFGGIDGNIILIPILIIIVGILAVLAQAWPISGDEIAGLPIFTEVLSLNRITGTEPFHGTGTPVTPRNELIVWTYLEILTNKVSGTFPIEFFVNSRPILVIMAILSLYTFLHQFFRDKVQTLFLLCLWGIYLLATIQADGTGSNLLTRIIQDKFFGWFVVIPIIMVFTLWFFEERNWRNLIGLAMVVFGAAMVHPITLLQAMILIGGFGLLSLIFDRSRRVFVNLIIVAFVFLFSTAIPFLQYIRFSNYMPIELIGLGDAVEFGRLTSAVGRYRLWLLSGERFTLHPSIILESIVIAAYILLPFIIFKARKHKAARLILGTLLILPILLYVPTFAALAGRVVTPYLIWRLAWPFQLFAILTIGWVLWILFQKMYESIDRTKIRNFINFVIPPLLVSVVIVVALPKIKSGLIDYNNRKEEIQLSVCVTAKNVLSYMSELSNEESVNLLSSPHVNICVPGYAPLTNVVEFRGLGTVNRLSENKLLESMQRVEDVNYFKTAKYFDNLLLEAIDRHEIDYVLVQKDRMELDFQFKYFTTNFQSIYEDENYHLYEVLSPITSNKVVEGNTALRLRHFKTALDIFTQILQEEPKNVLAHLGLGLAQEGLGEPESAIISFEKALSYAPNEPALHAQLANTHLLTKNLSEAIHEYEIAIKLSPERESLHLALGNLLVVTGQEKTVRGNFERLVASRIEKDTALYFSNLGHLYQSVDMISDAINSYEKTITLEVDSQNYINLASALAFSGETADAMENYGKAIELDRWNYLPHLYLGQIYMEQDRNDDAIAELEIAIRLKPTNIAAYILLGQAINEKSGIDVAVARLEELQSVSSVLPGPYRSIATLMATNNEYYEALQEYDNNARIQPNNATIFTAIGYISLANDQVVPAYDAFEQALFINPDLISARLGLSQLYRNETNYDLEAGQLLQIIRLAPTLSWSHLKLAETYSRQGDWNVAQDYIDWALEIDPKNVDGYISRGNLKTNRMDWDSAISDYNIALEIEPDNRLALMGLGNVNMQLANYSDAQTLFERAVDLEQDSLYPRMKLAEIYWYHGLFEEAIALEETTVAMMPDAEYALTKLADIFRLLGRTEDAKLLYEQALQSEPGTVAAYSALAQLAAEKGADQNSVYSFYNLALTANPESAEAHLASGQFLLEQGQFDLAEQTLRSGLSFEDVSPENYLLLSMLQSQRGSEEDALGTLQTLVKVFPENANAFQYLASFYLNAGNLDLAENYFAKAIELNPANISAYTGLSQTNLEKGDSEGAQRTLQDAIIQNPGSLEAYLSMASLQETIGELTNAEFYYKEALAMMPADIRIYQKLGEFYFRQGNFDAALSNFKHALSLPGPKLEVLIDIGDLYMAMGETDDALQWYMDAVSLDRSDPSPLLALANYYQTLDKPEEALNALNEAYSIQPNHFEVNFALGKQHQSLGNIDAAEVFLQRASELNRSQEKSLLALAEQYQTIGYWPNAIAYAQKAIEISPTNLAAHVLLGQTYSLSGDQTKAEKAFSEGISMSIDEQGAYLARADFYKSLANWDLAKADYETAWDLAPDSQQVGLILARFHNNRGNYEQALLVLEKLEKFVGLDAQVKIEFGNAYASTVNWPQAIEAYTQAIEIDETNIEGYIGLARVYELQGNMSLALRTYQALSNIAPDDPEVLITLGNAYLVRGNYADAYTAFDSANKLDPTNKTAMVMLNQISQITGSPDVDISALLDHIDETQSTDGYITLANYYLLSGEMNASNYWLSTAIQRDPHNSSVWFELGNYYRAMKKWDQALEAYNTALTYESYPATIFLALGIVQEELGMLDEAIATYQKAIETAPANIQGYQSLANLQFEIGETDLSLDTIKDGIALVPADPRGYQTLGEIYESQGNITQAIATYQDGLKSIPGAADFYVKLGDQQMLSVLEAKDKLEYTESLELWAQYQVERIQEQSTSAKTRSEIRVTTLKLEDILASYESIHNRLEAAQLAYEQTSTEFEDSKASYQMALDLQSNNENALLGLGKLNLAAGSPEIAIEYFQQASKANPDSLLSLGYLGNTYLNLDRPQEAINVFERMLVYDQDNLLAHLGISRAHQSLEQIDIHQAAESANHWQFHMKALADYLRIVERLEVATTIE